MLNVIMEMLHNLQGLQLLLSMTFGCVGLKMCEKRFDFRICFLIDQQLGFIGG